MLAFTAIFCGRVMAATDDNALRSGRGTAEGVQRPLTRLGNVCLLTAVAGCHAILRPL